MSCRECYGIAYLIVKSSGRGFVMPASGGEAVSAIRADTGAAELTWRPSALTGFASASMTAAGDRLFVIQAPPSGLAMAEATLDGLEAEAIATEVERQLPGEEEVWANTQDSASVRCSPVGG